MKQIARDIIKIYDRQLNNELAKRVINPYYFTERLIEIAFNNKLDSHHINHINCKIAIEPIYLEIEINLY